MKKKTVHNPAFLTVLSFSALFLVNTAVAQSGGPQAYCLIGTIQSEDFTGAVINDPTGVQSFYRLKEKLPDGSTIVQVRPDSITLRGADGTSYDMYILHETKAVASIKPDAPADPYAAGAIRNIDAEQPNSPVRRRGRAGRQRSEAE